MLTGRQQWNTERENRIEHTKNASNKCVKFVLIRLTLSVGNFAWCTHTGKKQGQEKSNISQREWTLVESLKIESIHVLRLALSGIEVVCAWQQLIHTRVCQINYEHNDLRRKFCTRVCVDVLFSLLLGSAIVCDMKSSAMINRQWFFRLFRIFSPLFLYFLFAIFLVVKVVPLDLMTFNSRKNSNAISCVFFWLLIVLFWGYSKLEWQMEFLIIPKSQQNIEIFGVNLLVVNEIWASSNWKRFPRQAIIDLFCL